MFPKMFLFTLLLVGSNSFSIEVGTPLRRSLEAPAEGGNPLRRSLEAPVEGGNPLRRSLGNDCGDWDRNPYNNECYKLFLSPKTFDQAMTQCASYGGTVSKIDKQENFVFISSQAGSWAASQHSWLEYIWVWLDNDWKNKKVNGEDPAMVLNMSKKDDPSEAMVVVAKTETHPFVCQAKNAPKAKSVLKVRTCNVGYAQSGHTTTIDVCEGETCKTLTQKFSSRNKEYEFQIDGLKLESGYQIKINHPNTDGVCFQSFKVNDRTLDIEAFWLDVGCRAYGGVSCSPEKTRATIEVSSLAIKTCNVGYSQSGHVTTMNICDAENCKTFTQRFNKRNSEFNFVIDELELSSGYQIRINHPNTDGVCFQSFKLNGRTLAVEPFWLDVGCNAYGGVDCSRQKTKMDISSLTIKTCDVLHAQSNHITEIFVGSTEGEYEFTNRFDARNKEFVFDIAGQSFDYGFQMGIEHEDADGVCIQSIKHNGKALDIEPFWLDYGCRSMSGIRCAPGKTQAEVYAMVLSLQTCDVSNAQSNHVSIVSICTDDNCVDFTQKFNARNKEFNFEFASLSLSQLKINHPNTDGVCIGSVKIFGMHLDKIDPFWLDVGCVSGSIACSSEKTSKTIKLR